MLEKVSPLKRLLKPSELRKIKLSHSQVESPVFINCLVNNPLN